MKIPKYTLDKINRRAKAGEEPKTIYQVCFDAIDHHDHIKSVVCYETDSEYDAQCYIGEMYHLGDYSNYYVRVKKENNNDN